MKKAILSAVELENENNSIACEYMDCVKDIYHSNSMKKLDKFEQHKHTSRLQHSVNVSYYSFLWSKKLGLDYRSAARAGLMHDMYYYDFLIEMGLEIFAANLDNYNFDYDLEVKSDNLLKVAKESQ